MRGAANHNTMSASDDTFVRTLYALAFHREAGVGIEPAYTALQAAA